MLRDTTFFRKQLALFTSESVRQHPGACNVRYYVVAYLIICKHKSFGAKLEDVFPGSFPCASHRPAAFCKFHKQVLVLVTAFVHASIRPIIALEFTDCQV